MPFPPKKFLCGISNSLIVEERSYDLHAMMVEHRNLHINLNANQIFIYDVVIESVYNNKRGLFFVFGSGGVW